MINVLEYLENTLQSKKNGDKTAFLDEESSLSFSELSSISRSIGSYLSAKSIYRKPVVVFMEKSPAQIAAFLGVLYGGNYYVPIDADIPTLRIKLILDTCNPALIICDDKTGSLIKNWDVEYQTAKYEDIKAFDINNAALDTIRDKMVDVDPIYIVFTSGSTGVPKGVITNHRAVIDYIDNLSEVLQIDQDTVFGMQSPLYLDACLKEIYPTLKYGAAAYLIPRALFMFPVKLLEYITDKKINTICWVASALSLVAGLGALEKHIPHTLRTIAFGSEVFPIKHFNLWRKLLPGTRLVHLYGPTEATGMSTYYVIKNTDEFFCGTNELISGSKIKKSIPVGKPFNNTEIVLLDDNNQVPACGEPGEICIRGTCLAPGYFGDPGRTNEVFVQNPIADYPDRIYRTGDMGYIDDECNLYFISRKDFQIKHMGHRIELKEIEWYATQENGIEMACAVFDDIDNRIVLYCLAPSIEKADILKFLKANMPRFMVPHVVIKLDEMPLGPGGKIDRAGLLEKYKLSKKETCI